ncbi:pyridoxamine 5'-phosphate oxidase family protein [Streptomyces sp. NPDC005283]|uniref:pyridoxamine 5'-phosphate oxidase family protein n=1 Tax=Streptomyces sp. NPDC005283 TaxID=3156871 RepID=UPI003455276C
MSPHDETVGSPGERMVQKQFGTADRAADFYDRQMHDFLTPPMREFIARQTMVFLSTADASGACDSTFRAGPPGFVTALDARTLTYPEYRGNGVLASVGNIAENPHLGLLFIDFTRHHIGLHINGAAELRTEQEQRAEYPGLPMDAAPGRQPQMWIHMTVEEAYVHCSKHIPHLEPAPRPRASEMNRPKDSAYFTDRMPAHPAASGASGAFGADSGESLPESRRLRRWLRR